MPRIPTICTYPLCNALSVAASSRCEKHHRDHVRGPRSNFYALAAWRKLRARYLRAFPACVVCGDTHEPMHVDHVRPIAAGGDPFDTSNLQTLCASCHSAKTMREMTAVRRR